MNIIRWGYWQVCSLNTPLLYMRKGTSNGSVSVGRKGGRQVGGAPRSPGRNASFAWGQGLWCSPLLPDTLPACLPLPPPSFSFWAFLHSGLDVGTGSKWSSMCRTLPARVSGVVGSGPEGWLQVLGSDSGSSLPSPVRNWQVTSGPLIREDGQTASS